MTKNDLGIILISLALSAAADNWAAHAQSPSPDVTTPQGAPAPDSARGGRTPPKTGQEVLVVLASGEQLEGEFVSQDAIRVVLRIAGVEVNLDRPGIERMTVLDPPEVRYKRMRAAIADDDPDRLVMLAEWLQRRRMFKEALAELDTALKADPSHADALRTRAIVAPLAALAERSSPGQGAHEDRERQAREARRFPTRPKITDFPLLSKHDINLLKVYEVDLRDPPKLTVARETVERLLVQYGEEPIIPGTREGREAFLKKPAEEVLDVMFRLRAREMYGEVKVHDQPRSMRKFRDHVHAGWLVTSCASTACHGGSEAGRLQLFNYRPTSDESVYTNFLILDRFVTRDGERLIDYDKPDRSLLVQMALPRDDVRSPHPQIPGWRPAFRSRDARRYVQTLDWIRSMYRPRPDYPVEYQPPGSRSPAEGEPTPDEPVER
jgi:hypothetical protein